MKVSNVKNCFRSKSKTIQVTDNILLIFITRDIKCRLTSSHLVCAVSREKTKPKSQSARRRFMKLTDNSKKKPRRHNTDVCIVNSN